MRNQEQLCKSVEHMPLVWSRIWFGYEAHVSSRIGLGLLLAIAFQCWEARAEEVVQSNVRQVQSNRETIPQLSGNSVLDAVRKGMPDYVRSILNSHDRTGVLEPMTHLERAPGTNWLIKGQPLAGLVERKLDTNLYRLSLAECRQIALERQLQIKAELIPPKVAEYRVTEARAAFDAVIFGGISRKLDDPETPAPGTTSVQASAGVRIPTRTGAALTLSNPLIRTDFDTPPPGAPSHFYSASPVLSLTQPLLKGAGLRINESSIHRARLLHRQTRSGAKLAVLNLLANVDRVYWQLWMARGELEIRHEQYKLAEQQLAHARRMVEAGIVPKIEILRSEVGMSQRVNSIIIAETTRRLIEREMRRVLNLPRLDSDVERAVFPTTSPALFPISVDPEILVESAYKQRMDLMSTQIQLAMDVLDQELARNQMLPDVALSFDYSLSSRGTTLGKAYEALDGSGPNYWQAGVSVSMPLGNGAARARSRQAALRHSATLNNLEQRRQFIQQEVENAVDRLAQSWQLIDASVQEMAMSRRIYDGEVKQFEGGVRTSTEVLAAAQFLANAQIRNLQAISDYEIAKVELAYATGTHLGYSDVMLEETTPKAKP